MRPIRLKILAARTTWIALALVLASGMSGSALAQTTSASDRVSPPAPEPALPTRESRISWTISERVRYSGLFNQWRPAILIEA